MKALLVILVLSAAAVVARKPLGRLFTRATNTWVGSSGS